MKKQLLFVMFMVMGLFASAQNSDREEAYRDGYRDGQEDAERSGQQSQQEREEEAYRRGYRDGQRDARDRDGDLLPSLTVSKSVPMNEIVKNVAQTESAMNLEMNPLVIAHKVALRVAVRQRRVILPFRVLLSRSAPIM